MSRGSTRGRGRAGFARGGKMRIGGQELEYDPELDDAIDYKAQDGFPPLDVPKLSPATAAEHEAIGHFMALRQRIHRGPLHTVQGDDFRVNKARLPAAARYDPFEGMRSYSSKYLPPQRTLPNFSTRKYPSRFFPEELLDAVEGRKAPRARAKGRRAARVDSKLEDIADEDEGDEGEREGGEEKQQKGEDEAEPEENPDEDFSDDESDMAGDYNAEAYFDGGDDDGDEAEGGGGDDGEYD